MGGFKFEFDVVDWGAMLVAKRSDPKAPASHGVDAESSARNLDDKFLTAPKHLAAQITNQFTESCRAVQYETGADKLRITLWQADLFTCSPGDSQERDHFQV